MMAGHYCTHTHPGIHTHTPSHTFTRIYILEPIRPMRMTGEVGRAWGTDAKNEREKERA